MTEYMNLTPRSLTFHTLEGQAFTLPAAAEPLFRTEKQHTPVQPITVEDTPIPVTRIEMGAVALPQTSGPLVLALPTAEYLAQQGQLPQQAYVPDGEVRNHAGMIEGYTALAKVLPPEQEASETTDPVAPESIESLEVLTPHGADFLLDHDHVSVPAALTGEEARRVGRRGESRIERGEVTTAHGTLPVRDLRLGAVEGLPQPRAGTGLIVSRPAAVAAARGDLFCLDTVFQDGKPVGARGLHQLLG